MEVLSARIRLLRKERKITQSELAKSLGISMSAYCRYEHGEREPDASTLKAIADFYDVSADYLLGRSDALR